MPFRNEFLLRLPGMHENHVGIAAAAGVERLAGALRHHLHIDAGLGLEQRQDVAEQAGVLRRSGRCNHDGFILRRSERYLRKGKGNHQREISHRGTLIEWATEYSQLSRARCRQATYTNRCPSALGQSRRTRCLRCPVSSNCCVHFALVVPVLVRWVAQVGANILTNEVYSLPAADFWKPATIQAINIGLAIATVRVSQTVFESQSGPSASAPKDL